MGLFYNVFAGRVSFRGLGNPVHYEPPAEMPSSVQMNSVMIDERGLSLIGSDFIDVHDRVTKSTSSLADRADRLFTGVGQGVCGDVQVAEMLMGGWPAGLLMGHSDLARKACMHAWNTAFLGAKNLRQELRIDNPLPQSVNDHWNSLQEQLSTSDWKQRGQAQGLVPPVHDVVQLVVELPTPLTDIAAADSSALVRNKTRATEIMRECTEVKERYHDPKSQYIELSRRQNGTSRSPWCFSVECVYEEEDDAMAASLTIGVDPWTLLVVHSTAPSVSEHDVLFAQWAAHDDAVLTRRGAEAEWTSGGHESYVEQYTQVTRWGRDTKETRRASKTVLEMLATHPMKEWATERAEEYAMSKAYLVSHNRPPPREMINHPEKQ